MSQPVLLTASEMHWKGLSANY